MVGYDMSDSKFPFNDILKLEKIQSLPFGGIIIDANDSRGFKRKPDRKRNNMTIRDHLLLFPVGMRENNELKDDGLVFSKMWYNGACKPLPGDLKIKDIDPKMSDWLNENTISSFSQKIGTRSPEQLNSLFGCFKMFGGNNRFSPKIKIEENKFKDMVDKGVVLEEWKETPIPIKYALRSQRNKHNLDFLFLIGGSDVLFRDEHFDDLQSELRSSFSSINNFLVSGSAIDLKDWHYFIANDGIWSTDEVEELKKLNDDCKSFAKLVRSISRIMIGIIYIRNFMLYAQNVLGEKSFDVLDFNATGCDLVTCGEVLDRYDYIYNYIRNFVMLADLA